VYSWLSYKSNVPFRTEYKGPEMEYNYSCSLLLTSLVDGVGSQHHAPTALPPGKTRHPLIRGSSFQFA